MRGALGNEHTEALRRAYVDRVPGNADLVCYWFEKAREAVRSGTAQRVGLVATQSIRKGASRRVLNAISSTTTIFDAWSDEPWIVDGANVRVSLICFGNRSASSIHLNGESVSAIYPDLTSGVANLTVAKRLAENRGICFQGPVKVGAFDIAGAMAREWLTLPKNVNGRSNADVLRPWANGTDIVRRWSDTWIIDFGDRSEKEAAFYAVPFGHVLRQVKPQRDQNRRERRRLSWWLHGETVPGLRSALNGLSRYIATPRVAKHRIFVWLHSSVLPDTRLVAIARDDDAAFGILHSRIHEIWSLAHASRHGVGNDPTYNSDTCFETFPFPENFALNLLNASAGDPRIAAVAQAARELVDAREQWLNPPELVRRLPEVVSGFPDRIVPADETAADILKTRTLTKLYNDRGTPEGRWLDNFHRTLDAAVAAAYGWPADISDDDAFARLLDLNKLRAAMQARQPRTVGRPGPQSTLLLPIAGAQATSTEAAASADRAQKSKRRERKRA